MLWPTTSKSIKKDIIVLTTTFLSSYSLSNSFQQETLKHYDAKKSSQKQYPSSIKHVALYVSKLCPNVFNFWSQLFPSLWYWWRLRIYVMDCYRHWSLSSRRLQKRLYPSAFSLCYSQPEYFGKASSSKKWNFAFIISCSWPLSWSHSIISVTLIMLCSRLAFKIGSWKHACSSKIISRGNLWSNGLSELFTQQHSPLNTDFSSVKHQTLWS